MAGHQAMTAPHDRQLDLGAAIGRLEGLAVSLSVAMQVYEMAISPRPNSSHNQAAAISGEDDDQPARDRVEA
jgi:hypothetical protein